MPASKSATASAMGSARPAWEAPAVTVLLLAAAGTGSAISQRTLAAPAAVASGGLVKLNVAGDLQFQGNQDFF